MTLKTNPSDANTPIPISISFSPYFFFYLSVSVRVRGMLQAVAGLADSEERRNNFRSTPFHHSLLSEVCFWSWSLNICFLGWCVTSGTLLCSCICLWQVLHSKYEQKYTAIQWANSFFMLSELVLLLRLVLVFKGFLGGGMIFLLLNYFILLEYSLLTLSSFIGTLSKNKWRGFHIIIILLQ